MISAAQQKLGRFVSDHVWVGNLKSDMLQLAKTQMCQVNVQTCLILSEGCSGATQKPFPTALQQAASAPNAQMNASVTYVMSREVKTLPDGWLDRCRTTIRTADQGSVVLLLKRVDCRQMTPA